MSERPVRPAFFRSAYSGVAGQVRGYATRIRIGDLGPLPVIIGLAVIAVIFQSLNPYFLSSANLANLALESAAVGTISLGIVLVLLAGEIDISVGSVSGLSAAILATTFVQLQWPLVTSLLLAMVVGAAIGAFYGLLYVRFGVPSFVITLAGLLAVLGLQIGILGTRGSVNIPFDSWIVQFAQQMFLPPWVAMVLAVVLVGVRIWLRLGRAHHRRELGLPVPSAVVVFALNGLLLAFLLAGIWYLAQSRGVAVMFCFFVALVMVMDLAIRRTRWGRSVLAIGGSVEAARRAGIRVGAVYVSIFALCSTLAAVGGLLAAARLASASPSSGGGDTNLNAIAAAVIGGTSLFGGRGSAYSAFLGVIVITAISSGLNLLSLDSAVRYVITGAVLLVAVVVDAISHVSRSAHGRA